MKLRFGWWNAGLSGKRAPAKTQIAVAAKVIRALMRREDCAVVGLCEVRPAVLVALMKQVLPGTTWRSLAAQEDMQRPHDLALLFDPARVQAIVEAPTFARVGGRRSYAGLVFELGLPTAVSIKLVLCHWPPVGMGDQDHARIMRHEAGSSLKATLRGDAEGRLCDALVMGDFNAEPFSASLRMLGGTRDIERVREAQRGLFYNVAWRWLGPQEPFNGRRRERGPSPTGTYLFDGPESQWRTYDQILVSPSLVQGRGWTLREDETYPWHDEVLRGLRDGYLYEHIDHLPVVVTLEYIEPAD